MEKASSMDWVFIFLTVSFKEQKYFSLVKSNLALFFVVDNAFVHI